MNEPSQRFGRSEGIFGISGRRLLQSLEVAVAGLGGVGSMALEALARDGIGSFRLIDKDRVELSNFNRQLIATEPALGEMKTDAARKRIHEINPACGIATFPLIISADTLTSFLAPPPDFLLDAIDDVEAKAAMLAYAVDHKIPVITSMGAAGRFNPLAVRVDDLANTHSCPLARKLRRLLRRHPVGRAIRCVFSDEYPRKTSVPTTPLRTGPRAIPNHHPPEKSTPAYGTYIGVTAVFGLLAAHEIIRRALASSNETRSAGFVDPDKKA